MATKDIKLVAWGHGDRTVGDGLFTAELTVRDLDEGYGTKMVPYLKGVMVNAMSNLWDLAPERVNVQTQEEHDAMCAVEEDT